MGDKPGVAKEEVLEPRPPQAPSSEPYDTNTTAATIIANTKLPYAEQPAAYDDDYLGLGYTSYYYSRLLPPRGLLFHRLLRTTATLSYADLLSVFSSLRTAITRRFVLGSGCSSHSATSHWGGHSLGWMEWTSLGWLARRQLHGGTGRWKLHDGRGPRFGDRPRSIMMVNNGPAGMISSMHAELPAAALPRPLASGRQPRE